MQMAPQTMEVVMRGMQKSTLPGPSPVSNMSARSSKGQEGLQVPRTLKKVLIAVTALFLLGYLPPLAGLTELTVGCQLTEGGAWHVQPRVLMSVEP